MVRSGLSEQSETRLTRQELELFGVQHVLMYRSRVLSFVRGVLCP